MGDEAEGESGGVAAGEGLLRPAGEEAQPAASRRSSVAARTRPRRCLRPAIMSPIVAQSPHNMADGMAFSGASRLGIPEGWYLSVVLTEVDLEEVP